MKHYLTSMLAIALVALVTGCSVAPTTRTVYVQTSLTMTQSTEADGATVVTATLKDSNGSPVSNVPIAFSRGGSPCVGSMVLATVNTNANGVALINLGEVTELAFEMEATFDGANNFEKSEAMLVIERPSVSASSEKTNASGVRSSVSDESISAPEGSLITAKSPLLPTVLFTLVVGFVLGWAWTMVRVRSQPVGEAN